MGEIDNPEDMGRGRSAKGNALPLSESVQTPDAVDCRVAGASEDCPADLLAGHPHQNVPALPSGRGDGEDAGLGGRRVRRLHADLTRTRATAGGVTAWPLQPLSAMMQSPHAIWSRRDAGSFRHVGKSGPPNEACEEDASWLM